TTLSDFGLQPQTTYHYSIEAFGPTGTSTRQDVPVTTGSLPTAARLAGAMSLSLTYSDSNYGSPKKGDVQAETWQFTPECATGACDVTVSGIHDNTQVTGTLKLQPDGSYVGTYAYTYATDSCGNSSLTADIDLTPSVATYTIDGEYVVVASTGSYK